MSGYRVSFYKCLVNSYGRPFKTLQAEIDVIRANTTAEAELIAQRQFEQLRGVTSWHFQADIAETELTAF
jgi:hypothetical protein